MYGRASCSGIWKEVVTPMSNPRLHELSAWRPRCNLSVSTSDVRGACATGRAAIRFFAQQQRANSTMPTHRTCRIDVHCSLRALRPCTWLFRPKLVAGEHGAAAAVIFNDILRLARSLHGRTLAACLTGCLARVKLLRAAPPNDNAPHAGNS